ncbi:GlxA family transcriptional regulator [Amphritea balenae]|uniref:GlxA family transcriptional regulator n=1 Tax=Amphritea balenae TaxID=452629 RepID=A0A3P1SJ63_9GAMM|nr:GlxA family transcriptional regulator [Amphritea balenae]RRC97096.1 GlxA family transcriptional regulator [Amphritea balenae]GGK67967.1 protein GbdR [Amphritea balenae]
MTPQQQTPAPTRIGFLLVEKFSMIAVSSAIEPLRMANRLADQALYEWPVITMDGEPVYASNDLTIPPGYSINNMPPVDILFVCSGVDVSGVFSKEMEKFLCKQDRQKVKLGGLCTGTYLLARSGLMDGYKCTVHWENMASMREQFPKIQLSDELYEIDRNRYTCAGGNAPMDMMLNLITETNSGKLSANISEQFMCDRIRGRHDRQRMPLQLHLGSGQPKLIEAVTLMEANIEEPMSVDELSQLVGVSRRQLERLFQKHLSCVPTRYYMNLRLNCARRLLLQTDKSVVDVSLACGFVSAPHFSKCYRDYFGLPPRDERKLKTPVS